MTSLPVSLSTRPSPSLRRLPLPRIESSTGYYPPPPGAQVVPLLRFRQALALGGGERGEALSSAGRCCGGWSRAPLFLEARPVASYSGDRRRAWVMHHQNRELSAWNRVSAAALSSAMSPAARSSLRARSLTEKWTIRSRSGGGDGRLMSSHTSAYGGTAVGEARR